MTNANVVSDNLVVSLHYTLRLSNGEVVDSSVEGEPLQFLQGTGNIIPGLEAALYGMAVGEEKEVTVAPADGYGEADPEEYELVSRDLFPDDLNLTEGMGLRMRDGNTGELIEAYVVEVRPDSVLLDFNHPLAGETLHFHVQIAGLRAATLEELAHGHVHGLDGDH